jgi:hypothetical protein
MSTREHPAVDAEHGDLSSLTLVLPRHLKHDSLLQSLVRAIEQARINVADRVQLFLYLEDTYAASGDRLRQALCRGQALAGEHAAEALDEAIVETFDLWQQYEAQDPAMHQAVTPAVAPQHRPTGVIHRFRLSCIRFRKASPQH